MANEAKIQTSGGAVTVNRLFEQPSDAMTCYADFAQVLATGSEVVLQFYETIPGPPGQGGAVTTVRSRLRATVIVSPQHAVTLARLLQQHLKPDPGKQGTTP